MIQFSVMLIWSVITCLDRVHRLQNCIWYDNGNNGLKINFKEPMSFWFLQGLSSLTCNNLRLKADIIFFFAFSCCVDMAQNHIISCKNLWFNTRGLCYSVLGENARFSHFRFISETILLISLFFFLIMIHTWLLPETKPAFANGKLIFGNISYIVKVIFFCVSIFFITYIYNYLRGESIKTRELLWSK